MAGTASFDDAPAADPPALPESVVRRRRRDTRYLLAALFCLMASVQLGDAAAPTLAVSAPLLLVLLSPRARHVLLATRSVAVVPLVIVALVRRLLPAAVYYGLGGLHGKRVMDWADRHAGAIGRWGREIEGLFADHARIVVVALPMPLTALLAGSSVMGLALFLGLFAAGVTIRLVLLVWIGDVFGGTLDSLLEFIREYRWWLTGATTGLVLVHVVLQRHKWRRRARLEPEDGAN